jgi:hypothetical protein
MLGAITRGSAGNDLAPFGNEALQRPNVFVVDRKRFVGTKAADLAASARSPTCATVAPIAVAATALAAGLLAGIGGGRWF